MAPPNSNTAPWVTESRRLRLAALGIFLATCAIFSRSIGNDFILFDDDKYLTANPAVQDGLTLKSLVWAFTDTKAAHLYFPVTWLSHLLDVSLFGMNPAGHHAVSVLLHAVSSATLFLFLRHLTGAFWRSLIVAALFAWHPLRVESVSWAAERKDVLSVLAGLLTLQLYLWHSRNPRWWRLGCVWVMFLIGLLCKPMLVTLPGVMLLLDYWPLGRVTPAWNRKALARMGVLIAEKMPLLVLSAALAIATYRAQRSGGAMGIEGEYPLTGRLANAGVSYVWYLAKFFVPSGLAVYYPWRGDWSATISFAAWSVVAAATLVSIVSRKLAPYLFVGWLWYLGTLVPVIGLVQVGAQARGDRFTYFPMIGVTIALVWGLSAVLDRFRWVGPTHALAARRVFGVVGVSWAAVLVLVTWRQQSLWRNTDAAFSNAIRVAGPSRLACYNLAMAVAGNDPVRAISLYEDALRFAPGDEAVISNLARILLRTEQFDRAITVLQDGLRKRPDSSILWTNLASAYMLGGNFEHAAPAARRAFELDPRNGAAALALGRAMLTLGDAPAATAALSNAVRLEPDDADARLLLGSSLNRLNRPDLAQEHLLRAAALKPDDPQIRNSLGACYARLGRMQEAIEQFEMAVKLDPGYELARNNLGRAREEMRR